MVSPKHTDSEFDKISEIGKQQTKEKCLDYITCMESFFLSLISTDVSSSQVKNKKKSIHLPRYALLTSDTYVSIHLRGWSYKTTNLLGETEGTQRWIQVKGSNEFL